VSRSIERFRDEELIMSRITRSDPEGAFLRPVWLLLWVLLWVLLGVVALSCSTGLAGEGIVWSWSLGLGLS
jgi:hypothetical protein